MNAELIPCAWQVVDEAAYTSLHRERALATNYLSHVRGGVLHALVRATHAHAALERQKLHYEGVIRDLQEERTAP